MVDLLLTNLLMSMFVLDRGSKSIIFESIGVLTPDVAGQVETTCSTFSIGLSLSLIVGSLQILQ